MCEISRSRYSAYLLHVHAIFMTKYRRPVFSELHRANMRQYVAKVYVDFDTGLKECDGETGHVHILIECPPSVQPTKLANSLKSITSRQLRNDLIDLRAAYSKPVLWSHSYFIGSYGGAPLEVMEECIQNQRG